MSHSIRVPGVTCTPLKFDVLTVDMISPADRHTLTAVVQKFKTAAQAKAEASKHGLAFTQIDNYGRVCALKWRGIEVAVLFNREFQTTTIAPMDKLPSCRMSSRDDAWVLINLLEVEKDKVIGKLQADLDSAKAEVARLSAMLRTFHIEKDAVVDKLNHSLASVELRVQGMEKSKKRAEAAIVELRKQIAQTPTKTRTPSKPVQAAASATKAKPKPKKAAAVAKPKPKSKKRVRK